MNRPGLVWMAFAAAVATVLGVMVFFTSKMLAFERTAVQTQAQAALEENVRLALWRMDSVAAKLVGAGVIVLPSPAPPVIAGSFAPALNAPPAQPSQTLLNNGNIAQRFEKGAQTSISQLEFQQREALTQSLEISATDWRAMAPALLDRIADILPGATLEAAPAGANRNDNRGDDTRRLASIPARLVVPPGAAPDSSLPWNTPLRVSLMVAWGCVLLAAGAVGWMLAATLALSRRRGDFASAVTHELRTPLTTMRMYSEMLSAGMVGDEARRAEYLRTLVVESDRLGRLIENVLAYSRMENRLSRRNAEAVNVGRIMEQTLPSLRRRVEQAGWMLEEDVPAGAAGVVCRTDVMGVQQILLNLVDNACKHGRAPVVLSVRMVGTKMEFVVSDGGPGLARGARPFTAFGKAKDDAAPGIGLGLYLSRQIAREMGGELEHRPQTVGTAFALVLSV